MALTDLSDEISPFPEADNLLDYGGGDSQEANTNNSFPLQKLRPIRSHSGNVLVVGVGDGDGDSPHTKLCSESGSGYGYSSPELQVEVPPSLGGSSNCSVDAAVNPSTEGGTPLWNIVSKKLEQLGYQTKLLGGHPPLQAAFDSAATTTTTTTTTTMTTSNDSNQNHENATMVIQSSSPPVHHPCSDPIEIANMLVELHSTSCSPETNNQKKRKTCATTQVELFLLNMVEKVMKKQEEMHTQLIHMIDKQEKERMTREEAWRQQELERQKKEQLMRDQQTSRNLSLISLIETLMGEQIQIQSPQPNKHEDSTTKRWPDSEVKALIESRTAVYHKFHNVDPKHNTWDEVSHIMSSMGYTRNAKKCKEKWENINKYFKKTVERGRRPKSSKTCPYFDELDVLYRKGNLNPGGSELIVSSDNNSLHQPTSSLKVDSDDAIEPKS